MCVSLIHAPNVSSGVESANLFANTLRRPPSIFNAASCAAVQRCLVAAAASPPSSLPEAFSSSESLITIGGLGERDPSLGDGLSTRVVRRTRLRDEGGGVLLASSSDAETSELRDRFLPAAEDLD